MLLKSYNFSVNDMDIKIGKFTLETLTTGMYDSPKDIYREYIQNAADSIDNAIAEGILKKSNGRIDILIDKKARTIEIDDNGTGINTSNVAGFLLNIGDSVKLNSVNRGFRGIGRLAGLAYCSELTFTTSSYGEDAKSIVVFDAEKLRASLYSQNSTDSLEEIFTSIISIKKEREVKGAHYFKVFLSGVNDIDNILDDKEVNNYLSQVAPVPFSPSFKWKDIIKSKISYRGFCISEYNIFLKGESISCQVFKNYKDIFISDRVRKAEDSIKDIEEIVISNNDSPLAILWVAKTDYSGTVQDTLIKGIRLRKGNIQLGGSSVLNSIFRDSRFNGWLIGELHLISPEFIPNARRDNIEKTKAYYDLQAKLIEWADKVSSEIRKVSISRNSDKGNKRIEELIDVVSRDATQDVKVEILSENEIEQKQEYDDVAHTELINQLDILINQKSFCTKYKALNLQVELTVEEKKILEKIFDIIKEKEPTKADKLISAIIKEYRMKELLKK